MAESLPQEFVDYLRVWPMARATMFQKEVRRLYAMPEVHDRLDQLNVPPAQRDEMVRQQAAKNAQALAMNEMQQMREHYKVGSLTPDTLKAALDEHYQQFAPRDKDVEIAKGLGRDAQADFAKQTLTDSANKFREMSSYVPFDENQANGKPVEMPAEDVTAAKGAEGAPKAAGGSYDPISAYMLAAGKQGNQQALGQPVTAPVLPPPNEPPPAPSAPVASAEVPNAGNP